jgi:hypothetical protein
MCQIGNLSPDCAEEKWLTIPYLPNYQASCWGNIRNAKTGRLKAQHKNWAGYLRVQIWKGKRPDRQNKNYSSHRIVACTWIYDDGREMDVNHKNLKRNDNRACNLEYLTHLENCNYEPAESAL